MPKKTHILVNIDGKEYNYSDASKTYLDFIEHVFTIVDENVFAKDFPGIAKKNKSDFTESQNKSVTLSKSSNYYIHNSYLNNKDKTRNIQKIISKYKLNGSVEYTKITTESKAEETLLLEDNDYSINPFGAIINTSAYCILGDSGVGKSYRVEKTLIKQKHEYYYVNPNSASTNLLVQYDRGKYVLSGLGKFIEKAINDKGNLYTIILDECHKYIDKINDELLQCLSSKRNDGNRFISMDNPIIEELFGFLENKNGRGMLTPNIGFILISSKSDIINNSDIYERISIVYYNKDMRNMDFSIENITNVENAIEEYSL